MNETFAHTTGRLSTCEPITRDWHRMFSECYKTKKRQSEASRFITRRRIVFGTNVSTTVRAIARPGFHIAALLLIAVTTFALGCARRFPTPEVTRIKAANPAELQQYLLSRQPDVAQFRLRGPFAATERRDLEIPVIPGLTVEADLYLCAAAQKAPLVIVLHGHNNSKEDHAFQAMHLASWGMHSLALDLPKRGPWIANGRTLAQLVDTIHRTPQLVDRRIDPEKIFLVGHSCGPTPAATPVAPNE